MTTLASHRSPDKMSGLRLPPSGKDTDTLTPLNLSSFPSKASDMGPDLITSRVWIYFYDNIFIYLFLIP